MNNDVVSLGFDLTQILGKTEEEAVALLNSVNRTHRVVERDGKAFMVTTDFNRSRINLNIVGGLVSSYSLG